jgi:glutaminyl-peptide cyclotransferase
VKFPGKKDGIIVLATHYETNYWLKDTTFVGANDGASTTGLLIEIANHLRGAANRATATASGWSSSTAKRRSRAGRFRLALWQPPSRGEVAERRHPQEDQGLLLADMIGDKDLDILRDGNSTPWLTDLVKQAAVTRATSATSSTARRSRRGRPSAVRAARRPGDRHHRRRLWAARRGASRRVPPHSRRHAGQDQRKSLTIDGDVFLEAIRLLDQRYLMWPP